MGINFHHWVDRHNCSLPVDARKGALVMPDKVLLGYYACAALGLIFGMIIMAHVRVERGDLDAPDPDDNFDFWIDD